MSHLEGIVNSILHSSSSICGLISCPSNRFANESDSSKSLVAKSSVMFVSAVLSL